jgi:ribosomal protein L31E
LARSVIRYLDALVIWQPISSQRFFRDINANCDLHKTFLCLVLSCEPGARVSVQVERKDEGNHTHLRSMATKTKPIRPPPPPGIFGVPGSGSRNAWEPVPHKTRQKSGPAKKPAEQVVKDIRRATRRQFSAEEKIRIVLEGLRGEESIAELCRREGSSRTSIIAGRRISSKPARSGWLATRRGPRPRTRSRTFAARRRL